MAINSTEVARGVHEGPGKGHHSGASSRPLLHASLPPEPLRLPAPVVPVPALPPVGPPALCRPGHGVCLKEPDI